MNIAVKKQLDTTKPVTVREYEIRGTKYIVKATVRDSANEDAAAKVRRLIRNEMSRKADD